MVIQKEIEIRMAAVSPNTENKVEDSTRAYLYSLGFKNTNVLKTPSHYFWGVLGLS